MLQEQDRALEFVPAALVWDVVPVELWSDGANRQRVFTRISEVVPVPVLEEMVWEALVIEKLRSEGAQGGSRRFPWASSASP